MSEFKIESGIPIPKGGIGGKKGESKYPFKQMQIGDSFFILFKKKTFTSPCAYARQTGTKFTVRKIDDGFRVWRIK